MVAIKPIFTDIILSKTRKISPRTKQICNYLLLKYILLYVNLPYIKIPNRKIGKRLIKHLY